MANDTSLQRLYLNCLTSKTSTSSRLRQILTLHHIFLYALCLQCSFLVQQHKLSDETKQIRIRENESTGSCLTIYVS